MLDDSREITTANVLIRLFLLGAPVDKSTVLEFVPEPVVAFCIDTGLLEVEGKHARGGIVIIPIDDLLFASDAFRILGTEDAAKFVLPASTHSANYLRFLTMRTPVDSMLDLGCGCGIHALFAARHCNQVIATDISRSAVQYTRFNAMLNNMENIECRQGDLFDPVASQRFDLIVSNPPFVVSPGETFVYRDNALHLDEFCRFLIEAAPAHLNDNGHLQMLCEWVEQDGQPWQERLQTWVRGCDAWILHSSPVLPADYVRQRSNDISGEAVNTGAADDWSAYLHSHNVRAIHPGMITLRRREGQNWLHFRSLPGDVTSEAGHAVAEGIAAIDFLETCDDASMLEATLRIAEKLEAEQIQEDGTAAGVYLHMDNGLSTEAEVDGPVAAFLNLFDGRHSVRECINKFGSLTDADADQLANDLIAILRVFVSRGILVPADIE